MVVAGATLGPIRSNIPLAPDLALPADLRAAGHIMIDFGDDRLTAGRPHPMVDGTLRLDRLAAEAADAEVAVVLLDVVLGYGAHPDPAADLAPALDAARATAREAGRDLAVVVSLCGTADDPQGFDRQAGALRDAGAEVYLSNAAAAHRAAALAGGGAP
jgi:FdrA protein